MHGAFLQTFASESASADTDILTGLGINWTLLVLQLIAFVILVWALGKFVYPVLMRIIDERQAKIDEAGKAAEIAEKKAEEAEAKIEAAMKQARTEAAEIVTTAKNEATQMIHTAEDQAKKRSERIVADAHETIEKDIIAAQKKLESNTIKLVKDAARIAVMDLADTKLDTALIKKSVEEAK